MEERLLGMLSTQPEGLAVDDLKRMLQQILNLPSSLAYPLFHKLAAKGEERVASGALLHWASMHNLCGAPEQRRAFDILRQVSGWMLWLLGWLVGWLVGWMG
jgi:hypothetical protein